MANFRTTADYVDSILQLAGELTNGTSSLEAKALQYLNTVHKSVLMGGSIFDTEVDEIWDWARSQQPIRLELLPSIEGNVLLSKGSEDITFSAIPTDEDVANASMQGWYVQFGDDNTTYQLGEHTSGNVVAELTSNYIGTSGTRTYTAYKLDYVLEPTHITIATGQNDYLFYSELDSKAASSVVIPGGVYTPTELATQITTTLNAAGGSTYTVSYLSDRKLFNLSSDRSANDNVFWLVGNDDTQQYNIRRRSILPTLGFGARDEEGQFFISDIILGAVGKLVQPFKIPSSFRDMGNIYGLNSLNFDKRFPISITKQKNPTHFSVINQSDEGEITVRMSAYPQERQSIMVDYVPYPIPLYDVAGSHPLFPQQYSEILEYGASSKLLMEKEDSKWELYLGMAAKQLTAMMKANRKSATRYGERFGQVVARQDLTREYSRRLRYGYTNEDN